MTGALVVTRTGPLASVQDLGRPGYARVGVGRGGACDRSSLRLANRLVGNPDGAAAIEVTAGGFAAYAGGPWLLAAVTGADGPVHVGGRPVGVNAPFDWPAGAELRIGPTTAGLRSYIAVAGGIEGPRLLGSRSYSVLGGLGSALAAGDMVTIGEAAVRAAIVDHAAVPRPPVAHVVLDATPGPRLDRFGRSAVEVLLGTEFVVTAELDRIGVRLAGPPVIALAMPELPTEGMVRGAVQIPRSGQPIVFLADHPATGGYPVPVVLTEAAADRAGQLTPGMTVRLRLRAHATGLSAQRHTVWV